MASFFKTIADAVRQVVSTVPGCPQRIEVRDNDQLESREEDDFVIVTLGEDPEVWGTTAVSSSTLGDVGKAYMIGVTLYHRKIADPTVNLNAAPEFVLKCKQALDKPSLAQAPSVYGTQLVENPAWEDQEFTKGLQVTRFGMIFLSAEPRNG